MSVTTEAAQEKLHLLVDHGVVGHALGKISLACGIRQVAIKQQVTGFHEVAIGRQLFNRVTAIQQLTFVAINIGDR